MNGNVAQANVLGQVPTEWTVATIGDVDADGTADVIWRNSNNGSVAIWEMANNEVKSSVVYTAPADWQIIGSGNFNPDNKTDVLWQNTDGTVAIWQDKWH
jgi:hypothetical protein